MLKFNRIRQQFFQRIQHGKQKSDIDYRLPLFINKPKLPVFKKEKGELKKADTLIFGDEIGCVPPDQTAHVNRIVLKLNTAIGSH